VRIWNWFFGNNSDNLEPITTKFHTEMGLRWDASGNVGHPQSRARKMAQKTLSLRQRLWNAISQWSISVKFGHNTWMSSSIFSEKNCQIFLLRGHLPQKRLFEVCFSGCLIISLQRNWLVSESKWWMCLYQVTFVYDLGDILRWKYQIIHLGFVVSRHVKFDFFTIRNSFWNTRILF